MSDIQIPQRQVPQMQFQGAPGDLIQALYNRPKTGEIAAQSINQGVQGLLDQYYKSRQLQAGAFEAGGPYLMNLLYGNGRPSGQMPQTQSVPPQSSNVTPPVAGTPGGTTPGNYGASPQTTAQTMPGGMPTIPQGGGSQAIPETIQASLNMGHPDLTGLYSSAQQFAPMGKYGREQTQNLATQGQLAMLPMQQAKNEAEMRAAQAKFATPEQGAAIASGDPAAVASAYGGSAPVEAYTTAKQESQFRRGKTAEATEKVGEELKIVGTINDQVTQLEKLFKGYKPVPFLGKAGATLAAKSGSATFGTPTMQQGQRIEQITPGLAANVNYMLSHRFSPLEADLIRTQVTPTSQDNEQNAMRKIQNLKEMVNVMYQGNLDQIANVASAVAGRQVVPHLPTGINAENQSQTSPQGRITVKSPSGQIGHIPASQLQAALAKGYTRQ